MNKKDEALKLAQDLRTLADRFSEGWHDGIKIDASEIMLLTDAAATLAEQKSGIKQVIELYDSPEQPAPATELREQEPAFYRHEDGHLMTPDRAKFLGFDLNDLQPLYTDPPAQRTWVGLTDEEKADLFEGTAPYYNETDYADAIEAKLKEKNT